MTDAQVEKCRKRLETFLADLLEPLASRVPDGNVQAMQQLVGQSPWDWLPIWELLGNE
jgi:hypothetical protein